MLVQASEHTCLRALCRNRPPALFSQSPNEEWVIRNDPIHAHIHQLLCDAEVVDLEQFSRAVGEKAFKRLTVQGTTIRPSLCASSTISLVVNSVGSTPATGERVAAWMDLAACEIRVPSSVPGKSLRSIPASQGDRPSCPTATVALSIYHVNQGEANAS